MIGFEIKWNAENAFGEPLIGFSLVRAEDEAAAKAVALSRAAKFCASRSVKVHGVRSARRLGWWEAFARGAV